MICRRVLFHAACLVASPALCAAQDEVLIPELPMTCPPFMYQSL